MFLMITTMVMLILAHFALRWRDHLHYKEFIYKYVFGGDENIDGNKVDYKAKFK